MELSWMRWSVQPGWTKTSSNLSIPYKYDDFLDCLQKFISLPFVHSFQRKLHMLLLYHFQIAIQHIHLRHQAVTLLFTLFVLSHCLFWKIILFRSDLLSIWVGSKHRSSRNMLHVCKTSTQLYFCCFRRLPILLQIKFANF